MLVIWHDLWQRTSGPTLLPNRRTAYSPPVRPRPGRVRLPIAYGLQKFCPTDTVEEIVHAHPHLKVAAVYDALSYSLDHQQDLEQEIAANRLETLQATYSLAIDARGFASFPREVLAR